MEKEVYIILTRGNDGKFTISTYETLEKAKDALKMYVEAQKEIEGLGSAAVEIDWHEGERLRIPEFVLRDDNILKHATVSIYYGNKTVKTNRYIIRNELN